MRRTLLVFALAALAAAALSAGAFAKEGGVELSSTPFGIEPGDPWTGTLTVYTLDGSTQTYDPSVTIRNLDTGATETFAAEPAKAPSSPEAQSFVFTVVFPAEGRYRYSATDGVTDREYEFPVVRIVGPEATAIPGPTAGNAGSFPLWPLVGIVGGAATLTLAAFLVVRSRRFAH